MRQKSGFLVVFLTICVSLLSLGATCTPKKVCEPLQSWNLKSGELLPQVWDFWEQHLLDVNSEIIDEILDKYSEELNNDRIDELVAAIEDGEVPTDPVVVSILEEYNTRMRIYMEVSEKLERALNHTASSMEIVESASIACQDYSARDIRKGIRETLRGLREIIELLDEIEEVPVPDWLMEATEQVSEIEGRL